MPGSLNQILGVRSLTDMVRTFFEEPHQTICMDRFRAGRQLMPEGDTAEWDEQQAHRHLAPYTGHKAPFVNVQETDFINRQAALAHIKVYKDLDAHRMFNMRALGSESADARQYLMQELEDLTNLVMRSAEYACNRTLHNNLDINAANVPGSTIDFTYVPGIQTQTAVASWLLAATDIVSSELPILQAGYTQNAGRVPAQIIHNDVTDRTIRSNDEVSTYVREVYSAEFLANGHVTSELFDKMKLGGLIWRKNVGGYVPEGGAFTRYVDDERLIVLPADTELRNVLGMAEGWGLVPQNAFASPAEAGGALVARAPSRGIYSYAEVKSNPAGIRVYVGYPFLPVVLTPSSVMLFDTTP